MNFLNCLVAYLFINQSQKDVEKEQEAQLRAKYPGMKGPGTSALLQKRLAQKVHLVFTVQQSVCVCLSHVGVVLKWLNIGTRKQCHTIAQEL